MTRLTMSDRGPHNLERLIGHDGYLNVLDLTYENMMENNMVDMVELLDSLPYDRDTSRLLINKLKYHNIIKSKIGVRIKDGKYKSNRDKPLRSTLLWMDENILEKYCNFYLKNMFVS